MPDLYLIPYIESVLLLIWAKTARSALRLVSGCTCFEKIVFQETVASHFFVNSAKVARNLRKMSLSKISKRVGDAVDHSSTSLPDLLHTNLKYPVYSHSQS